MMKELKKDLQSVLKDLKALTKKTEKIVKKLNRLENAKPRKALKRKSPPKAAKKAKKETAMNTVLATLRRNKKGIDSAKLKKKTGVSDNNLRTIVYRLRKQGKIKSERRGFYVKV